MELTLILSTVFLNYDFKLAPEDAKRLETREGFLRKPLGLRVGLRKRQR